MLIGSYAFAAVPPALVQDTYKFKECQSRGPLSVEETPALSVLFLLVFLNQGRGDTQRGEAPNSVVQNQLC